MKAAELIQTLQFAKGACAFMAVLLIIGYWLHNRLYKDRSGRATWPLDIALIALACVSIAAYFDFWKYPKFRSFMNPHDIYHYYMGSKYSPEVGYLNLYQCTAVADWESSGKPSTSNFSRIRSMTDYSFENGGSVVGRADYYRAMFTPARWEEFKKDCKYFSERLRKSRWQGVTQDMGYNATPVWNMIARIFTERISTESTAGMAFLVSLDLMLVALMTLLASWAFGWRTGLLALIFFCTCFCMSFTHIRGGFLRLDWVTMLVMSACFIKKGWWKTAGALMGYAAMARVFPLVFVFGLGSKFVWDFFRTYRLKKNYMEFFIAFSVTCATFICLSLIFDGGIQHWRAFAEKISLHNNYFAPPRVGFRNIFLMSYAYPPGGWPAYSEQAHQKLQDWKLLWYGIQGGVLLLCFFASRKLDDYETIPLGYVPAFLMTAPTFYYHVMLITALFLFLPKRDQVSRLIGTIGLFLSSILLFVFIASLQLNLGFAFRMACVLLAISVYMLIVSFTAQPNSTLTAQQQQEETCDPKQTRGSHKGRKKDKRTP
jgi:hypothetical protein